MQEKEHTQSLLLTNNIVFFVLFFGSLQLVLFVELLFQPIHGHPEYFHQWPPLDFFEIQSNLEFLCINLIFPMHHVQFLLLNDSFLQFLFEEFVLHPDRLFLSLSSGALAIVFFFLIPPSFIGSLH